MNKKNTPAKKEKALKKTIVAAKSPAPKIIEPKKAPALIQTAIIVDVDDDDDDLLIVDAELDIDEIDEDDADMDKDEVVDAADEDDAEEEDMPDGAKGFDDAAPVGDFDDDDDDF